METSPRIGGLMSWASACTADSTSSPAPASDNRQEASRRAHPPKVIRADTSTFNGRRGRGLWRLLRFFVLGHADGLEIVGRVEFGPVGTPGGVLENAIELADA